jgi:hypothetical protein
MLESPKGGGAIQEPSTDSKLGPKLFQKGGVLQKSQDNIMNFGQTNMSISNDSSSINSNSSNNTVSSGQSGMIPLDTLNNSTNSSLTP